MALYVNRPIGRFRDLTTTYAFPDGYEEALVYQLARRLAKPYGREVDEDLKEKSDMALSVIKRANVRLIAMNNYFGTRQWYNFDADQVM